MQYETSVCFSGYRAEKFPFPLQRGNEAFEAFRKLLRQTILDAVNDGYDTFYTGACYGFDIAAGEEVLSLKRERGLSLRLIAVLPFENQAQLWSERWRDRYFAMLESCDNVVTIQPRYTRGCYQRRNEYMVNRSSRLICYYTGQPGGTQNTVEAAEKLGLEIVILSGQDSEPSNILSFHQDA